MIQPVHQLDNGDYKSKSIAWVSVSVGDIVLIWKDFVVARKCRNHLFGEHVKLFLWNIIRLLYASLEQWILPQLFPFYTPSQPTLQPMKSKMKKYIAVWTKDQDQDLE